MEFSARVVTHHKHLRLTALIFQQLKTFSHQLLLQSSTPQMFAGVLALSLGRKAVIEKVA